MCVCVYIYIYIYIYAHRKELCFILTNVFILIYECPGYNTKQSDGEVPVMGNAKNPFLAINSRFILAQNGST